MSIASLRASLLVVAFTVLGAGSACGQSYPAHYIRVVTSEAGSGSDFVTRVIAQGLTNTIGQRVVVENHGGGVIAGELVAKAAPDGYTLLVYGSTFWLLPLMRAYVSYDPVKDFAPITLPVTTPNVLTVYPQIAANSVKELIALAKAKPRALNYSSGSAGAANHLAGELFKSMAGVDIVRVPYKGIASALNAVIAGEVQIMFPLVGMAMQQVKAGRLKGLAVTSAEPCTLAPGLPTLAATGLPGYEMVANYGIFAPAGTPEAIINRLNQETVRLLGDAETRERFFNSGMEAVGTTPEKFAAVMKSEIVRLGKVIKEAGIRDE